ncbi:MAG: hypothetical protein ACRDK1_11435 [Solirubrobacterales bacterium]
MSSAQATLKRPLSRAKGARAVPRVGAATFQGLLDKTLATIDADQRAGSKLRAAGLCMRLKFPDLGLSLSVAPSDERGHQIRWTFSEGRRWKPKLEMTMSSEVANAYLQGGESLAIAIARGRVRLKGETRSALHYVPAMRVVVDAYRRLLRDEHPELLI